MARQGIATLEDPEAFLGFGGDPMLPPTPSSSTADRAADMIRQMESGLPTGRPFSALVGDKDNLRVTRNPYEILADRQRQSGDLAVGMGLGLTADLAGLPADMLALVFSDAPKFAAALATGTPFAEMPTNVADEGLRALRNVLGSDAIAGYLGVTEEALQRPGVESGRILSSIVDPAVLAFMLRPLIRRLRPGVAGPRSTDALAAAAAGDAAARADIDFGVPPADEAAGPPDQGPMPAEARPPEAQPEADAAPEAQPEAAVVPDDVSIESLLTLDTQKPLPSISAPPDDLPAVSQADKTDPPVGAGGGESMHGARVDYSPTRTILGALPENTEFTGDQLLRLFDINNEALGNRPFRESIQRDLAGTRFDEWIRLNVPAGRTMSRDQLLEAFDKVAPELRMISLREPDLENSPIFYEPDGSEGFKRRNDGSPKFVGSRDDSFESYQETIPTNFIVPNTDPNRGGGVGVERVHFYLNNANDTAIRLSKRTEDQDEAQIQGIAPIAGDFGVPSELRFAHGADHGMGQTSSAGVPGLLAHGRAVIIEDAAGRKILVLQELQSNQALTAFRGPPNPFDRSFNGKAEGDFIYERQSSGDGVVYTEEGLAKVLRGETPTPDEIVQQNKTVPMVRDDDPTSPTYGRPVPARYVEKPELDADGNPRLNADGTPRTVTEYSDPREPIFSLAKAQLTPTVRSQMEILANMPEAELSNFMAMGKLQSLQEGLNRARTSVQRRQVNVNLGRPEYTPEALPTIDDVAAGAATPEAGELAKFLANTLVNSQKVSIEKFSQTQGLSTNTTVLESAEKARGDGEAGRAAIDKLFDTHYSANRNPSKRTPSVLQAIESDGPEAIARFDELWSASEQSVLGLSDEAMARIDGLPAPNVNQYGNYNFIDNIETLQQITEELTPVLEQRGLNATQARRTANDLAMDVVAPRLHRLSENKNPFEFIKERSTRDAAGSHSTKHQVFNNFVSRHVFDNSSPQTYDYIVGNKLLALEAAAKDPTLGDMAKVAQLLQAGRFRAKDTGDALNAGSNFVPQIPFANMKSLEEFHAKAFLMEAHRLHEAGEIDGVFLPNYHDMHDVGGRPPLKTVKGTYEDAVRKAVASLGLNADEVTVLEAKNFATGNIEEVSIGNRSGSRNHGEKGPGRMIYFNAPGNDLSDRVEGMRSLVIKRAKGGPVDLRPKKLVHSGIGAMARQVM